MKEKPILFSTDMVQAILDGRKTMTRRVVKPQPPKDYDYSGTDIDRASGASIFYACWEGKDFHNVKCPYGQPGDILWVREAYCKDYFEFGGGGHAYKADWSEIGAEYVPQPKWKPGIHMPKSAARIWLQVESVKVERLQDISEDDARLEGVLKIETTDIKQRMANYNNPSNAKHEYSYVVPFQTLWRSIHGPESWEQNPWVWVISFKVLSTTGIPTDL